MGLPSFIIMGAMKCATSSIQKQLSLQDGIFMSEPKEPNFFSDDSVYSKGFSWYSQLFDDARTGDILGEASTHYTKLPDKPNSVVRMKKMLPDVKLTEAFEYSNSSF